MKEVLDPGRCSCGLEAPAQLARRAVVPGPHARRDDEDPRLLAVGPCGCLAVFGRGHQRAERCEPGACRNRVPAWWCEEFSGRLTIGPRPPSYSTRTSGSAIAAFSGVRPRQGPTGTLNARSCRLSLLRIPRAGPGPAQLFLSESRQSRLLQGWSHSRGDSTGRAPRADSSLPERPFPQGPASPRRRRFPPAPAAETPAADHPPLVA